MFSDTGVPALASTLGALIIIFSALAGAILLARRFQNSAWARGNANQTPIKLIASRPLGGRNALHIVEADGKRFLIASGSNGLAGIGRLGGPE